jgi:hypothetical protein
VPSKKLFILANSIKKQHRCIVGREIIREQDGKEYYHEWIRPVTDHDEGAVTLQECTLQDGKIPIPFDVIQVPIRCCEENKTQPENWFINPDKPWSKKTTFDITEARKLIEEPDSLWLEPGERQDRVTPQYLYSQNKHQSIYLIKPENFRFFVEIKVWDGNEKKRVRGTFKYNKQSYSFSTTDPIISQRYFPNFGNAPSGYVDLEHNKDILICVSLTPEFNGYHYKIVATVIET